MDQSHTSGDVLARKLSPKGRWARGGVPARTLDPEWGVDCLTLIKVGNECQRPRWALMGSGLSSFGPARRLSPKGRWTPSGVPARTLNPKWGGLVSHRLEKETSVNVLAGSRWGVDCIAGPQRGG